MQGPEILSAGVEIQKPGEACGLAAVRIREGHVYGPVAQELTFLGIRQLRHRGHETTGMVIRYDDMDGIYMTIGDKGDAETALGGSTLLGQSGYMAMSHGRYATSNMDTPDTNPMAKIQPMNGLTRLGQISQIHNGDIANARRLSAELDHHEAELVSDSHLALQLVIDAIDNDGMDEVTALGHASHLMVGAYSMVTMINDRMFAWRDPWGFRPLYVAELPDGAGWATASEQPALQAMGCTTFREVPRGTAVEICDDGLLLHQLFPDDELAVIPESFCSFEFVYFSRPDSEHLGMSVEEVRVRSGELLAEEVAMSEVPVTIDVVVGTPESGMSGTEGYAYAAGVRQVKGLVKNTAPASRSFTATGNRQSNTQSKLNANGPVIRGKRVGRGDDSQVRGDSANAVNTMLRRHGVAEVHDLIFSPPYISTCEFGMDVKRIDNLVAVGRTPQEIARLTNADTTHFLSQEGFRRALTAEVAGRVCTKCTTGIDPTDTSEQQALYDDYLAKYLANRAA